ncbi:uncharacterized protein LOC130549385 [Triplophysa rosa]|uniref:uncharacterized protein LOC130549385 n=1 Tax=Triplophysa rosa TaxID=992332 RepID=UPI00254617FF|nr:uncharacterized protein LOC130549385 [Triplophysa rosa]
MKNIILSLLLVCGVFGDEVKISVMEGHSVTLHTYLTHIQTDDVIRWRFGEGESKHLLVDIVKNSIRYNGPFRDRLQTDGQTGDLTITNMRSKHSGLYEAQISRAETTYKRFRVTVTDAPRVISAGAGDVKSVSVSVGGSVTLHTDVQTHRDDLILWRFGDEDRLIAKHDKEDNKSSIHDDGMFRDRLKLDPHTGSLIITDIRITDSGLYKLKISSNNKQTLHKTFSVSVRDRGLSPGDVVGIVFGVLLCIVVGVIVFRRIKYELQKRTVKEKTGKNGSPVTLECDVTELQSDDVIEWSFRDKVIAKFSTDNKLFTADERFTDRLQVDDQTGSLIITDIRIEDAGLYKVKISSSSGVKSFLQLITGGGPSYSQFNLIVIEEERIESEVLGRSVSPEIDVTEMETDDVRAGASSTVDDIQLKVFVRERIRSVELGGSVTLDTDVTGIQTDDVIQWRFGDEETLIAEMTVGTEPSYDSTDERFTDRLKMNTKTGHLTITNITSELCGVYSAKISSRRGTEYRKYRVDISDSAGTEEDESTTVGTPLLPEAEDEV